MLLRKTSKQSDTLHPTGMQSALCRANLVYEREKTRRLESGGETKHGYSIIQNKILLPNSWGGLGSFVAKSHQPVGQKEFLRFFVVKEKELLDRPKDEKRVLIGKFLSKRGSPKVFVDLQSRLCLHVLPTCSKTFLVRTLFLNRFSRSKSRANKEPPFCLLSLFFSRWLSKANKELRQNSRSSVALVECISTCSLWPASRHSHAILTVSALDPEDRWSSSAIGVKWCGFRGIGLILNLMMILIFNFKVCNSYVIGLGWWVNWSKSECKWVKVKGVEFEEWLMIGLIEGRLVFASQSDTHTVKLFEE